MRQKLTFDTLLHEQHTTDWIFSSERKQRLSKRSLHHIIQQAGAIANLPLTTHPYMLRRSGLYYRAEIAAATYWIISTAVLFALELAWNDHFFYKPRVGRIPRHLPSY